MIRQEKGNRRGFVGHAQCRRLTGDRKRIGPELRGAQAVGTVVLRDDRAALLGISEEAG